MAVDFGFREGQAQLGSYRDIEGLHFVYAPRGDRDNPQAGTVEAWIAANGPWTNLKMMGAYEPVYVRNFPTRAAVTAGTLCQFPAVEADALVAAGLAAYA